MGRREPGELSSLLPRPPSALHPSSPITRDFPSLVSIRLVANHPSPIHDATNAGTEDSKDRMGGAAQVWSNLHATRYAVMRCDAMLQSGQKKVGVSIGGGTLGKLRQTGRQRKAVVSGILSVSPFR